MVTVGYYDMHLLKTMSEAMGLLKPPHFVLLVSAPSLIRTSFPSLGLKFRSFASIHVRHFWGLQKWKKSHPEPLAVNASTSARTCHTYFTQFCPRGYSPCLMIAWFLCQRGTRWSSASACGTCETGTFLDDETKKGVFLSRALGRKCSTRDMTFWVCDKRLLVPFYLM